MDGGRRGLKHEYFCPPQMDYHEKKQEMRQVVPNIYKLEGTRGANIYLLVSDKGLTLVDSGQAGDTDQIAAQIKEAGYALSDLGRILLTHAHGDHTGNVLELVRRSGAKVLAHRLEAPYVERTESLPAASQGLRVLNWLGDRLLFRLSPCKVDVRLGDGDVIEGSGGFRVVHTPGHTPGSICLYQPVMRCLITGDALFNANPVTGKPGLRLPIRMFTGDNSQALASVRKLSLLDVEVLCCGHGEPITANAGEQIKTLLKGEPS